MFFKKIDSRIKLIFFIIVLMFTFIVLRVAFIQLVSYEKLSLLANDLWSRDLPIEADRGLILDRNGAILADNLTTAGLILVPNQIEDYFY